MGKFDIVAHFKTMLSAKERKDEIIIDANKMTREILWNSDLSGLSREDLEYRFVSAYVRCLLYQANYRSVIRGKGFFVNEKTMRPELVARLFNNQKMTRDKAEQILANIKRHIRSNDTIAGQLEYDFETGECVESMTAEDLLKMLENEGV